MNHDSKTNLLLQELKVLQAQREDLKLALKRKQGEALAIVKPLEEALATCEEAIKTLEEAIQRAYWLH